MNNAIETQIEATMMSCASKAEHAKSAIDAAQYTQAMLNAVNALIALKNSER